MSELFWGEFKQIPDFSHLKKRLPQLELILFDMDGTLIDSEPVHAHAFLQALHRHGVTLPANLSKQELVHRYKGMADTDVVEKLKEEKILSHTVSSKQVLEDKHHQLLQLLKTQAVVLHQEMERLLQQIEQAGCRMGIVTASERQVLDAVIDCLKLDRRMQLFIGRQDAPETKPHPTPYKLAMSRMNVAAQATLIFEDSHTGLSAAGGSGAHYLKAAWFV